MNYNYFAFLDYLNGLIELADGFSFFLFELLVAILIISFIFLILYRARKQIIFNPWVNRFDHNDPDLGKSIADLLLFKLRTIKKTHEISGRKIGLWNTFEDIPSFRQNMDKEIDLLASVQLGNYGKIISGIFAFMFKIFPMLLKPANIAGHINKFGEKRTILQVSLENYRPRKWLNSETLLWEKEYAQLLKENIPKAVEEIACRIYIDLTGSELFKCSQTFMNFTVGLKSYVNYTELKMDVDLEDAEKKYMKALSFEKNNPVVKYNLGVLKYYQYHENLNEEAISYFSQALNCNERNLRARASSGISNALTQKVTRFKSAESQKLEILTEAIDYGEKAVELNKKLDSAYKSLAYALHQKGEFLAFNETYPRGVSAQLRARAIQNYKKAISLNKNHFVAHNNLANLYLHWAASIEGEISSPFELKNFQLKLKELFSKGVTIDKRRFLKKAIYHCEEALKINPTYQFAFNNLGHAYLKFKAYDKTFSAFQNALLYDPNYPEALNDLAILYLNKEFKRYNEEKSMLNHKAALELTKNQPGRHKKIKEEYDFYRNTLMV
ncbi:MAG TPA: hypothetical protein VK957_00150 [Lunatimonas sp.]|nr:hypothetical protein [Lunatimonas sp.]